VAKIERGPCGDTFAEMNGVSLSLRRTTILDHVDLKVMRGELLAIVGINGAGKSSLLRCLAGMWKPSKGEITIDGLDRESDDLATAASRPICRPTPRCTA